MRMSPVKSAARVIQILEYFGAVREPRALKQITETLRFPQSSTTVLLKSLIAMGYLNYDRAQRVYFPTLRVTSLGDWVPNALFGHGQIFEIMRDVHSATGETTSVVVLNDVYIQYIRVIQSRHALHFHIPEGSMRLVTHSAAGWILLSQKTDKEIDKIVRRANIATERVTDRVSVNEILSRMPEIRAQRVAYAENLPILGAATVCTLLPLKINNQPVAFGIGGLQERIGPQRNKYSALVKRAAQSLRAEERLQAA